MSRGRRRTDSRVVRKCESPPCDWFGWSFDGRLLWPAPGVRSLSSGGMEGQARKLMLTLAIVVKGPDHLDTIVPGVRALAVRHVAYDARPEYWDEASIWMLEQGMGHAFTPVVEAS